MKWREHLGTGGLIGAACAACCVPPLIASFGLIGGLAVTAGLVGGIAVAVAVLLGGVGFVLARRRRAATSCVSADGPVLVDPPTRRSA